MRMLIATCSLFWASAAVAHHELTPLREATIDGHSHDVGGATLWLVGTAVAMGVALYAVQKTVFRKR